MKLATRRMECTRCGQWSSYGTPCIGPCSDSTFTGHGHRDPLHVWRAILALRVIREKRLFLSPKPRASKCATRTSTTHIESRGQSPRSAARPQKT